MLLEIIIAAVIIVALLLLIGVKLQTILVVLGMIVLGLIVLAILSIILFFFLTDLFLLFRKPVKGKFLRVDDSGRMDHAIYQVGDAEYSCSFPAESFGRKRIYQTDQEYLLLIPRSGSRKTALDRHSLFILGVGTVISVFLTVLLAFGIPYFRALL
ncbi:MAG: hypothetical protein IKH27_00165 [Oscillospiraceae bacterium]|nr:hypothetical protein [Oscillospiraceae bacterium]